MARIRSIKPEFWSDYRLAQDLTRDERLFYIALWNEADDEGRFLAHPRRLLGVVFPYDDDLHESFIERSLNRLAETGRLILYEVNGEPYGQLTKFKDHQRVNRPQPSKLPAPPEDTRLTEHSVNTHGSVTAVIGDGDGDVDGDVNTSSSTTGAGARGLEDLKAYLGDHAAAADRFAESASHSKLWPKAILGLYGSSGTDERVWGKVDTADRPRLLATALDRYAGEAIEYNGRYFRRFLEAVVSELHGGGNGNHNGGVPTASRNMAPRARTRSPVVAQLRPGAERRRGFVHE